MTAQRIDFATTRQRPATAFAAQPKVNATLLCDDTSLRIGLQRILSRTAFVVTEYGAARGPERLLEQVQEPALIIVGVTQDSMRVPARVHQAKESFSAARIVAIADHFDLGLVRLGLEAGVNGFCLTTSSHEVLTKSFELIMLGETVLPSIVLRSVLNKGVRNSQPEPQGGTGEDLKSLDPKGRKLSARETEVLTCLMHGQPNKMIARRLDVAEATVKVHVKAVIRKIGAANRTQAAMWATAHLPMRTEARLDV